MENWTRKKLKQKFQLHKQRLKVHAAREKIEAFFFVEKSQQSNGRHMTTLMAWKQSRSSGCYVVDE